MNITLSVIFFIVSIVGTKIFCLFAKNTRLMDIPNQRSMHDKPKIRGGGLVFISLSLISILVLNIIYNIGIGEISVFSLSILLIAITSFVDDLKNLSAKTRLVIHALCGILILIWFKPTHLDLGMFIVKNTFFIGIFLIFFAIWAINHFNFMDGMDGFCTIQAVFLFSAYAWFFDLHNAVYWENFCLILVSCLLGFLIFNFPPAKIFMGDVGSATLGLTSFMVAAIGQQQFDIPLVYWFVLNGLFLFDSIITLARRALNNERLSEAHNKHAYQRLKRAGVGTFTILFAQTILNVGFLGLACLLMSNQAIGTYLIVCELIVLTVIYLIVEMKDKYNTNIKAKLA